MATKLPTLDAAHLFTIRDTVGIIGTGGYGTVRFCKNLKSEKFAVKYFAVTGSEDQINETSKKIMIESDVMHRLSHQNIIQVFGITKWRQYIGIVTEYLPRGDLYDFLKNKKLENIPWSLRLRLAVQLSEAICYLHQYKPKKVIHGDIKPENILLDKDLTVKLADFGSVNMVIHTGASATTTILPHNKQHTLYYTAPEILKTPDIESTTKMDVYSTGMVLYVIVTRCPPFENVKRHPDIICNAIINSGQRPHEKSLDSIQSQLSPDDLQIFKLLIKIMRQCWTQQPSDRPEMHTVRDSLRVLFDQIDDVTIKQQIRDVVEKLGRNEKDFDTRKGIPLNLISSDSVDFTQQQSVSPQTSNGESSNALPSPSANMIIDGPSAVVELDTNIAVSSEVHDSLHVIFDQIDDDTTKQQTRDVVEKLGKNEKDFDTKKGIPLNLISSDSVDVTLQQSVSPQTNKTKFNTFAPSTSANMMIGQSISASEVDTNIIGSSEGNGESSNALPSPSANMIIDESSSAVELDTNHAVSSEESSNDAPSTSANMMKDNAQLISDFPFTSKNKTVVSTTSASEEHTDTVASPEVRVIFNQIDDDTTKQKIRNLVQKLEKEETNFETRLQISSNLNFSDSDITPTLLQNIKTIKLYLGEQQIEKADLLCEILILSSNIKSVTDNCDVIIDDIIDIAIKLKNKAHYVISLSIMNWLMQLFGNIEDSQLKLKFEEVLRRIIREIADTMQEDCSEEGIKQNHKTLFLQMLERLNMLQTDDAMINDIVRIVSTLKGNSNYISTLSIMRTSMPLVANIEDQQLKLMILEEFRPITHQIALYKHEEEKVGSSSIKQGCLHLLKQLLDEINQVQTDDVIHKSHMAAWCMYSIGVCYDVIDNHKQAIHSYQSSIRLMESTFGEDSKKQKVVAYCCYGCAGANYAMGEYEKTKKLLEQSIDLFKAAEDIIDEDRDRRIANVKHWLSMIPLFQYYKLLLGNRFDSYYYNIGSDYILSILIAFIVIWFYVYEPQFILCVTIIIMYIVIVSIFLGYEIIYRQNVTHLNMLHKVINILLVTGGVFFILYYVPYLSGEEVIRFYGSWFWWCCIISIWFWPLFCQIKIKTIKSMKRVLAVIGSFVTISLMVQLFTITSLVQNDLTKLLKT